MATVVGVDLGGTNVRAAVADGAMHYEAPVMAHTPADEGPESVIATVTLAVQTALKGRQAESVAVAVPGPLDPVAGVVYAAPQLKGWVNLPAAKMLQDSLGCPVAIHNDATLAAYGEWVAGAGRGARNMIFITASSGIGGGLVLDGKLFGGVAGTAGEIGHMPFESAGPKCGEGHVGCLEGSASGTAIARRAREALATGMVSSLSAFSPSDINAKIVCDAAEAGDELGIRLYTEAGRAIGRAIGGLINLLSPELVIIGGGLMKAGDMLFGPLRQAVPEIAFDIPAQHCTIVPAQLGVDAGLMGTIAWAMKHTEG